VGRTIYEEFTTVVVLKQQMRVVDPVWQDFLQHLRQGHVQQHHMDMLHRMDLSHTDCASTDFTCPPWNESVLITPRHGVRTKWNDCAIRKHCQDTNQTLFVSHAEDRINGRTLRRPEQLAVQHRQGSTRRAGDDLPESIELAVGMRVMVTRNLDTDLDITNGARGTIVDVVVEADEPLTTDGNNVIHLRRPPAFLLVKLDKTRATRLEGLEHSVIPIEPLSKSFRISVQEEKTYTRTVMRKQLPITAAYACTDYRAQGQTIPAVVIDIASPPSGGLSLFNLYVALSRSRGRETIRLLRGFDERFFKVAQVAELTAEDERLEFLCRQTTMWWKRATQ
jgi:hypothetical protein